MPEHFEVKYDGNYERHKILSNWSDEFTEKFKKEIIENIVEDIVNVGIPGDEVAKSHSELCNIFGAWMQGKTTEYDENVFKILEFSLISPNKGFYLVGKKGTCKTTFMKAFRKAVKKYVAQFTDKGFEKVSGFEIQNEFTSYGARKVGYNGFEGGIEKYYKPFHSDTGRAFEVLYIDDFIFEGEAGSASHYGNSSKVAEDVIKARMDNGLLTFISSNFEPDVFSEPVVDRIKESLNVIFITTEESLRK